MIFLDSVFPALRELSLGLAKGDKMSLLYRCCVVRERSQDCTTTVGTCFVNVNLHYLQLGCVMDHYK